jgi:ABC-type antimicrobial peptide transport system permease subunit
VRYLQDDGPFYYRPLDLQQTKPPYMLVRVSGDPRGPAAAIRDIVRDVDPQMAVTVATLASRAEQQGEQMKPIMVYGAAAGMLALLLAVTGVYAVVSFSVSQRVREIGIRTALGASTRDVLRLFVIEGMKPALTGIAIGAAAAIASATLLNRMAFGVSASDPVTLMAVAAALGIIALAASFLPAWRASRLPPLKVLREP